MSEKKNIDDILSNLDRLLNEGIENEPEGESIAGVGQKATEASPERSTIDEDFSHGQMLGGRHEAEAMPVDESDSPRRKILLTAEMLVKAPADGPDDKSS